MLRARPMWIATRVPARVNCPACKAKDRAVLTPDSAENVYVYRCEACCRTSTLTLAELNDPAVAVTSAPPKRLSL
jgi:transcription elongation factor Elf1